MPIHHVKEQPAVSTYVQKRGVPLVTLIVGHPVREEEARNDKNACQCRVTKRLHQAVKKGAAKERQKCQVG